ncbi:unnamed protein product [Urochloa decumbens]|uniref:Thioredoxin domain-containing protein n=1 Tax=Urochloa decumbens TaxID=240449 RepID=A0ABC9AZ04_9POAL
MAQGNVVRTFQTKDHHFDTFKNNAPNKLFSSNDSMFKDLCVSMKTTFEEVAANANFKDKAAFCELNVNGFKELAKESGVEAYPTFVVLKGDKPMGKVGSMDEELNNLRDMIVAALKN